MLASDLNNKEFVGAVNPDDLLHVEFYWHEPIDWNKMQDTGREVKTGERLPYVRIMQPGNQTSIIETPVRDDHKARWPQKWLAWQMREGLIENAADDVPGWRIEEWPVIKPDQVRELKYLRFSTVEQIAGASDAQVQRLGMGGIGLREQARAAIKERMRAEVKEELQARDKEIAELREKDAAREKEMADIRATINAMSTPAQEPPAQPKRRGRPPKVQTA